MRDNQTHTAADQTQDLAERVARLEAIILGSDRGVPTAVAAERLGVHRNTLINWIHTGAAPARKWAGAWEVNPQWLATQLALRTTPER